MKSYDGGAWVGVTRIRDERDLQRAYDESGQRLITCRRAARASTCSPARCPSAPRRWSNAEFVATSLGDLDAVAHDYFSCADVDRLLVDTVRSTFPPHEHEQFVAHYRGLVGAWVADARR